MSLQIPSHIREADLVGAPLDYEWSPEIEDDVLLTQPRLTARISGMSYRAALALTLGCCEWVVWRVSAARPDRTAFHVLEACWAAILDWRYLRSLEFPDFDGALEEKVSGPLNQAFWIAHEALVFAQDGEPMWQFATSASELARRVAPDEGVFRAWRRDAVTRLVECFPTPADRLGAPVPRQFLEPGFRCEAEMIERALRAFLASLDPAENPYLRSAEELREIGFVGSPYTL